MSDAKKAFLESLLTAGEKYAGLLLGKNGEPDQHIILRPGEAQAVNLEDACKFASGAGGELPTRREQALLFANLPEEFKPDWYWSGEQRSAGSAWDQIFGDGGQDWASPAASAALSPSADQ